MLADIDECEEVANICTNGQCVNTPGSCRCECSPGYELSPTGDDCSGEQLLYVQCHDAGDWRAALINLF